MREQERERVQKPAESKKRKTKHPQRDRDGNVPGREEHTDSKGTGGEAEVVILLGHL